jgi:peptidoglycan hydrolase-like protein with peptidoglycan-binding domain
MAQPAPVRSGGARVLAVVGVAAAVAAVPGSARAGSADVAALQVAMNALGLYPHPVDGISGPWTESAVRSFQASRGLTVDGVAGPRTRRALVKRGRPQLGARPTRRGQSGWDVAALQFLLSARGFGPGNIDGGFGPNTEAAVRRFQAAAGVPADGVAGPSTLNALRSARLVAAAPADGVRFLRPVAGPMGDGFGFVAGRRHTGIDFPADAGTPVGAAGGGTVAFAGWNSGGYGNLVVVTHRLGFETWYAHLASIAVGQGASVAGGSSIGAVGSTGRSTGPHLHFEARLFGTPIDPLPRLLATVSARASSSPAARRAAGTTRSAKRSGKRRLCRANGDARRGPDADPLRARLDRCP